MRTIHILLFEISNLLQSAIDLPAEERTYYENVLNEIRRGALLGLLEMRKRSEEIRTEVKSRTYHFTGDPLPDYEELITIRTTALLEKIPVDHPVYEECKTILAFHKDGPPTWDQYKVFLNDCQNSIFLVELHDRIEGMTANMERHLQAIKERLLEFQPMKPEEEVILPHRKHFRISEEAHALLLASVAETKTITISDSSSNSNSSSCVSHT